MARGRGFGRGRTQYGNGKTQIAKRSVIFPCFGRFGCLSPMRRAPCGESLARIFGPGRSRRVPVQPASYPECRSRRSARPAGSRLPHPPHPATADSVRISPNRRGWKSCRLLPALGCANDFRLLFLSLSGLRCAVPYRSDRSALRCADLTFRPVLHCAVPGCAEAECSRRAVSQRPGRTVVLPCILCRTVQTLRTRAESSRPAPFAPRRSAGYGVSRRREIRSAAPLFSDGDCGEDRSDEPKPKPSAPPRSSSQRDPRRQPFRCRRWKRGVPKAARGAVGSRPLPPFLPVVGASDSLLSAAGTARSPVRRHSPNRRR